MDGSAERSFYSLRRRGGLRSPRGCLFEEARRTQRVGDLDIGAGLERKQRRAHGGVLEDAARDETVLERDGPFHMRATVIDARRHRQQPVMDRARLGVVLGLAGRDHVDQGLGSETAIANECAVHVEHRVQQVLVVAGENLQVRALPADHRDLAVPTAHVAHAVLHGEDAGLCRDFELSLEIVGRFRGVWILEQDQWQAALLVDRPVAILRRALLVAETQPAVRGIQETGLRAGSHGALRLLGGDLGAFHGDSSDHRNAALGRCHEATDHRGLLFGGEERAFAGVTEHDQPFHVLEAPEPGAKTLDRGMVNLAIAGEGSDGGGNETAQIKGFHVFLRCWPDRSRTLCRAFRSRANDPMEPGDMPEDLNLLFQVCPI